MLQVSRNKMMSECAFALATGSLGPDPFSKRAYTNDRLWSLWQDNLRNQCRKLEYAEANNHGGLGDYFSKETPPYRAI